MFQLSIDSFFLLRGATTARHINRSTPRRSLWLLSEKWINNIMSPWLWHDMHKTRRRRSVSIEHLKYLLGTSLKLPPVYGNRDLTPSSFFLLHLGSISDLPRSYVSCCRITSSVGWRVCKNVSSVQMGVTVGQLGTLCNILAYKKRNWKYEEHYL